MILKYRRVSLCNNNLSVHMASFSLVLSGVKVIKGGGHGEQALHQPCLKRGAFRMAKILRLHPSTLRLIMRKYQYIWYTHTVSALRLP